MLGQRLSSPSIGLNLAFEGVKERHGMVGHDVGFEMGANVKTELLTLVPAAETKANRPQPRRRTGGGVHHRREPTPVAVFAHRPSERTRFPFTLIGGRREERRWGSHGIPGSGSLDICEPFSQRRTRASTFFRRGIKHDHRGGCVQQMSKMMTPTANQAVGLEQPKFKLGRSVQPGRDRRAHGP